IASESIGGPPLLAASGHGGEDHQRVAHADGRVEAVEHPHVLVVEVHVDVAIEVAVRAEELRLGTGMPLDYRAEDLADVVTVGADLALAADGGAQHWGDTDRG